MLAARDKRADFERFDYPRFDQATTVCERIIEDPKHIDATGSVWFNLGTAYLARKQTKKARSAANEPSASCHGASVTSSARPRTRIRSGVRRRATRGTSSRS